jgi:hypothetical protein
MYNIGPKKKPTHFSCFFTIFDQNGIVMKNEYSVWYFLRLMIAAARKN